MSGDSTRVVRAGLPAPVAGEPFLPGPTFAAPYHLPGDPADTHFGYHRNDNPTWARYEAALGELEGGTATLFASGMAAASAVLMQLRPGDVLVAPNDAYGVIRALAQDQLAPGGVELRLVPSRDEAFLGALDGATLVWVESPANPWLELLDVARIADAAHAAGALLAVDSTLATPLRLRPLELGADAAVASAAKTLTGHSDLLLGYVAVPAGAEGRLTPESVRRFRTQTGSIAGPFETWLAHRSLATLALRLERQEANAAALVEMLRAHDGVSDVRWPGMGGVIAFTLPDAAAAQAFLEASALADEATSFGGVHTTGERRGRWGMEPVADGFIRFSCGIEDTADLLADIAAALPSG